MSSFLPQNIYLKHCQRLNEPEGWVHITSSQLTNLDQIIISESRGQCEGGGGEHGQGQGGWDSWSGLGSGECSSPAQLERWRVCQLQLHCRPILPTLLGDAPPHPACARQGCQPSTGHLPFAHHPASRQPVTQAVLCCCRSTSCHFSSCHYSSCHYSSCPRVEFISQKLD